MSQQVYCNVATQNVTIPSTVTKVDERIKRLRKRLGELIRAARDNKNYSQDGLAKAVGMERQQIYRIENGLTGTTNETILAIAGKLEVMPDKWLALSAGIDIEEQKTIRKPTNVMEFFEILDFIGLDVQFDGGFKTLEKLGADDLQELLDNIVVNASVKAKRKLQKLQEIN